MEDDSTLVGIPRGTQLLARLPLKDIVSVQGLTSNTGGTVTLGALAGVVLFFYIVTLPLRGT